MKYLLVGLSLLTLTGCELQAHIESKPNAKGPPPRVSASQPSLDQSIKALAKSNEDLFKAQKKLLDQKQRIIDGLARALVACTDGDRQLQKKETEGVIGELQH